MCNQRGDYIDHWRMGSPGKTWIQGQMRAVWALDLKNLFLYINPPQMTPDPENVAFLGVVGKCELCEQYNFLLFLSSILRQCNCCNI